MTLSSAAQRAWQIRPWGPWPLKAPRDLVVKQSGETKKDSRCFVKEVVVKSMCEAGLPGRNLEVRNVGTRSSA